ncbi:HNH endonuclease [Aeromonas enteropelogenes]|uniref:HNH endonuclease n=1 Tax=Aeromonas enteropelogenes TaxID=29489 RepID=UPI003F744E1E
MIRLTPPNFTFLEVFQSCLNDSNYNHVEEIRDIHSCIPRYERLYDIKASQVCLNKFRAAKHGHPDAIIRRRVTKADLVNLYDDCLSKEGKTSREIYNVIKASSNGLCPFCGFGNVRTLDHYMPKARYPIFSVHPKNLVPSCTDCNKGKGSTVISSQEGQVLHPYYIADHFINDDWIKADVMASNPVTFGFHVEPPTYWDDVSKERARNHFVDFDIEERFKIQSSLLTTMFTSQVSILLNTQRLTTQEIQHHFRSTASSERPNSIIRAMLLAISNSDWFCSGGFLE